MPLQIMESGFFTVGTPPGDREYSCCREIGSAEEPEFLSPVRKQ